MPLDPTDTLIPHSVVLQMVADAVKAEREACAKIAEARAAEGERHTWQAQEGVFIAADIRARS